MTINFERTETAFVERLTAGKRDCRHWATAGTVACPPCHPDQDISK